MRSGKLLSTLILTACCSLSAAAWQGTRTWQQNTFDDFSEGTAKGVAIRSRGVLELSPQFKQLHTSASTFVWSIASDEEGNVYLGTGSPARVYRLTPEGKATVIFAPKELQVQAIALDRGNPKVIYAATSPDGMLYKIEKGNAAAPVVKPADYVTEKSPASTEPVADAAYTSSVVFDPKTKYIWSLALREGEIYMATGDRGEIFKVTSTGQNSVFFKSDEAHIRTLAFSPQGELYAGTDGSGLVYRISKSGEGFVVYSAPKKEITALMVDEKGKVYAAGAGEKTVSVRATTTMPMTMPANPQMGPGGAQPIPMPTPNPGFGLSFSSSSGSEIYVISPEGAPRKLWTSKEDLVYALHRDAQGRLLAGTGNKGRVIAIEDNGDFTDLVKASASQVTGFAAALKGGTYAASSNLGKVFLLSASSDAEGSYESDVFDARIFSRWGRAEVRGEGDFELFSRSGNVDNPDRNWSPWKKIDLKKNAMVEAPPARFVQWKAVFPPTGSRPARITAVKLYYRPNNIAPVIEDVNVQAGARIPATPMPRGGGDMVMMGNSATSGSGSGVVNVPRFDSPVAAQRDKGSVAVRWTVRDENDDTLQYALYYKGDHETRWKLLKEKIIDRHYSWDAGLLPDGGYTVRVVASDAPSHTPDEALSDARESKRFEVDNGPPRIDSLAAKMEEGRLHISFSASDTFSPLERAEYSIDAGEWQFIEPVGQLSDSLTETYDFSAALPAATPAVVEKPKEKKRSVDSEPMETVSAPELSNEHIVIVRVYDRYDNVSTAKVVVK